MISIWKRKVWLILIFSMSFVLTEASEQNLVFENDEVVIFFAPEGFIVKSQKSKRDSKNYFKRYSYHIKFCKQPVLPNYVQQVVSSDGWLCNFYVLPYETEDKVRGQIKTAYKTNKYARFSDAKVIKINHFKVLTWRYSIGKTRLAHFLVFGKKHHYLFISSPYGEQRTILKLIKTMKYQ